MDVAAWLRGLALEQYAPAFHDNDVDGEVLSELTADDLISIGVTSVGHRRKLLAAITALKSDTASTLAAVASDELSPTPASVSAVRPTDAERRQLTVMFCDLVGSTEMSARLDPEDLSGVIGAFQKGCVSAVTGFGGSVAKYMGDGALVYFGYPEAHEDDAERAIRAGLALIDAMAAMRPAIPTLPQVRIGIATGVVVVGELIGKGSSQERVAVGETLNLAARIEAMASADTVVVAELTRRLAGAAFDYEDLGPHQLKGIPGVARLWRIVSESRARGRFDNRVVRGLTPLVGRAEEIALLRSRWDQAKDGDGQLILLSGPAGFGKSRMTQAFREDLGDSSITCLQYFGSPFHVNSAFYPFIRQLEWAAGIVRTDAGAQKLDKLEAMLEGSAEDRTEAATLVAALLSIPFGDRYPPLQITEPVQKQRTMDLLEKQLVLLSTHGPVLVIFEDTHWIDPTSIQLMNKLVRRVVDLPVLIIVTYRPEFTPPWLDLGHATMMKLNHLGRSQVVDLIHKTAGGKTLPEAIVEQVAAKSQGSPLFIEEITRSILESGDLEEVGERYVLRQSIRDFTIPSTLQELVDRASGPAWNGQGNCADGIDNRTGVFLRTDRGCIVGVAGDAAGRTRTARPLRSAGAAGRATGGALHLQARAHPRRGFSIDPQCTQARTPPTHSGSTRKPVPGSWRNRAGTARAPLYRSKRGRPCAGVLAPGRRASGGTISLYRGARTCWPGNEAHCRVG